MEGLEISEGALSSLRARIDKKFKATGGKTVRVRQSQAKGARKIKTSQTLAGNSRRTSNGNLHETRPQTSRGASKSQRAVHDSKNPPVPSRTVKRRLRSAQTKDYTISPGTDSNFRKEVFALGGVKEDLDLLNGVSSGTEVEGSNADADDALGRDLRTIIEELGVSKPRTEQQTELLEDIHSDSENRNHLEEPLNSSASMLNPVKRATRLQSSYSHDDLIFEPRPDWHSADLPHIPSMQRSELTAIEDVERLHEFARELLQQEGEKYALLNKNSSVAHQFYSTIMSSGTISDKISALTLSVQESPLHNQKALETLIGLARKRSRAQAIEVLVAIKDLLGPGGILPSDRRLIPFALQPGIYAMKPKDLEKWNKKLPLPNPCGRIHLISWAFEDWLKSSYFEIIKVLETWCNDEIIFARTRAVDIIFELLRDKPEQEANLLRLLVNKLGDTEKKIASRASYNILQLQIPHPLMKPAIISSIEEDILFKPGQSLHAKYYAVITLNQTVLSNKDGVVLRKLLDIYFSLFVAFLSKSESHPQERAKLGLNKTVEHQGGGSKPGKMARKKRESRASSTAPDEQHREKIMSAVLTGINRAVPYADVNDKFFTKHLDTLFRITHSSNFNTGIQALMLIQQLCGSHQAMSDRFYRSLYESLLDPRLLTTSKQALYLNLLYRALRADLNIKRVKAFSKRLLQVAAMHQPAFSSAAIYLLKDLESVFPTLSMLIDKPQDSIDNEEELFEDVSDGELKRGEGAAATETYSPMLPYNGKKRAPEHANADKSCLWELSPFINHYHPSVTLFAERCMAGAPMPPKPSLDSHTLIQFLDRYVYKNPKKNTGKMHGSSIMQPMAVVDGSSLLIAARGIREKEPVNSGAFYKMPNDKIDVADAFFHKYFNNRFHGKESAKEKKEKKKVKGANDEDESGNEDEVWQALVDSHPDIDGLHSDEDIEMEDYSDSDDPVGRGNDDLVEDGDVVSDQESEGGGLNFDVEDEGALFDSDDEVPGLLDHIFEREEIKNKPSSPPPSSSESVPWRKEQKERRRKLKALPTFASAEDYAAMLESDENEDY